MARNSTFASLRAMVLTLTMAFCLAANGGDLYRGKWFRLSGQWNGTRLNADRMDWREPGKVPGGGQILGLIDTVDTQEQSFSVGPIAMTWTSATRFDGIKPEALKSGDLVRVNIKPVDGRYVASVVELRPGSFARGALQITGMASAAHEGSDNSLTVTILGVPAYLAQGGYNRAASLTRRQDARRPDDQFKANVFGRPLTLGGEYVASPLYRKNDRLESKKNDRFDLDQELKLEVFYPLSERVALFADAKVVDERQLYRTGRDREDDFSLQRGQAWFYLGNLGGSNFGLQIGRQNFRETREWWWDDDLDAVRVYYDRGPWHVESGLAKELYRTSTLEKLDPEEKGIVRWISSVNYLWGPKQRLDFYLLRHEDRSNTQNPGAILAANEEDGSDARLTWFGLRAMGDTSVGDYGDIRYWADLGWLRGDEDKISFDDTTNGRLQVDSVKHRKVRASAYDLGVSWTMPVRLKPTITVGYARGSGDSNSKDDVDRNYRQTGIHNNKWRFNGVNRFRMYGELLRPELSNLGIATAALGFPLLNNSSVEAVYHRYRQANAADSFRDVRINRDPNGNSTDVGQAFDLVFGFRESRRWEYVLIGSTFVAGRAFDAPNKRAYSVLFELTYNF